MDTTNCPEFLKPRLRLFLSADIVGSTALKQSPFEQTGKSDQRTRWFSKIQGFYFEAQRAFLSECGSVCSDEKNATDFGELPSLWKTIGDEVLFVKVVTDHRQIVSTLGCWMKSIERMREFIKKDSPRLDIKCTAWLAGFPFRNSEVAVSSSSDSYSDANEDWFVASGDILNKTYENGPDLNIRVDYIGPSIDIGFRLGQFSSSRKFIISADIAFILSIANPGREHENNVFEVYFDGSKPLKGVHGGVDYPIFWLDLSPENSIDRFQDKISYIEPVNRDRLREYCNKFFDEYSRYTFAPFIISDTEQQINQKPSWYEEEHGKLVKGYTNSKAASKEQTASVDEPSAEEESNQVTLETFTNFLTEFSKVIRAPDKDGSEQK